LCGNDEMLVAVRHDGISRNNRYLHLTSAEIRRFEGYTFNKDILLQEDRVKSYPIEEKLIKQ